VRAIIACDGQEYFWERCLFNVSHLRKFVVAGLLLGAGLCPTPAMADAWGCSYDKCVAYCTKVSGKYCTAYCTKRLKEKVLAKTCPAS
jgi:hypothetical protein